MEAEKLKVIAEGMGYQTSIHYTEHLPTILYIYTDVSSYDVVYNPLTNAEQCMELQYKMLEDELCFSGNKESGYKMSYVGVEDSVEYKGKTINEAVCNAAFEYFKEVSGE